MAAKERRPRAEVAPPTPHLPTGMLTISYESFNYERGSFSLKYPAYDVPKDVITLLYKIADRLEKEEE